MSKQISDLIDIANTPCYCGSICLNLFVCACICDIICETKTNQLSLVTWAFFYGWHLNNFFSILFQINSIDECDCGDGCEKQKSTIEMQFSKGWTRRLFRYINSSCWQCGDYSNKIVLTINCIAKINHSVSLVITSTFCCVMAYIESKIVAMISDDLAWGK